MSPHERGRELIEAISLENTSASHGCISSGCSGSLLSWRMHNAQASCMMHILWRHPPSTLHLDPAHAEPHQPLESLNHILTMETRLPSDVSVSARPLSFHRSPGETARSYLRQSSASSGLASPH
jgi:hypothetical protein